MGNLACKAARAVAEDFGSGLVPSASECQFCDISAAYDRWLEHPGAITGLAYGEVIGDKP